MSDVMLAVLAGGIRRYCKLHQQPTANESLRVRLSPVSAIDIPLDLNDPLECLEYVTAMSKNAGNAREKRGKSSKFPSSIHVTTVPSPKSPLNLFGKRAIAIYPFPNIARGAGVHCAVFEYDDKVNLLLTIDTHTGAQRLQSCLDQSFAQLRQATGVRQQKTFNELLQQAPETDRYELLSEYVREQVAIVLNWEDEEPPDPQQGFFDLGLDSLSTLKLGDRLQAGFGKQLPATLIFDTPNIDALTNYLAREVLGWNELNSEPAVDTSHRQDETAHQLLEKIQYLSDDDVDRLLAKTWRVAEKRVK
jgi:acyl carrier protein